MTGLRGLQRGLHRLRVAHLPDEDDVGILSRDVTERGREVGGVDPDLALIDDREPVGVEHLDRIFDRHHVATPSGVDVVDHGGGRRRLPRTRHTGNEDQSAVFVAEPANR